MTAARQLSERISRIVFRLGSPSDVFYGFLTLRPDGTVFGYDHPNERRWMLENEDLLLLSESGVVTSRYSALADNTVWIGTHEGRLFPMALLPVIDFPPRRSRTDAPALVINTIPKSGTHLLQEFLGRIGWQGTSILITGESRLDDLRGAHRDHTLGARGLICPSDVAVGALQRSQILLTHSTNPRLRAAARSAGVSMVNVVRNLRDVLVSLFRQHRTEEIVHIAPSGGIRSAEEKQAFLRFLAWADTRDILTIRGVAEGIVGDTHSPLLRFEEVHTGQLGASFMAWLQAVQPIQQERLVAEMNAAKQTDTLTRIPGRARWEEYWNPDIELYFAKSGLAELNRALGYD